MRLPTALLLFCLWVPLSLAQAPRAIEFTIAAQPLSAALLQFSGQSGAQVLAAEERIANLRSPGVRGRMGAAVAMRRLLAGTGLRFEQPDDDTFVLRRGREPRALPPATQAPADQPHGAGSPVDAHTATALLEEVIVTAQRRVEAIQDTPLSISVVTGEQLARRGVTTLTDLAGGAIPSLRISSYIGRTSLLNVAMRGIHSGDATQISRDAGVGVYIDGVHLGRSQGLGAEFLDIERMEILRGPQGTLFGRNAVGGALHLVPRRPSGHFELQQSLTLRSGDGQAITTRLDLPRLGDFAAKFDATLNQRDGQVGNQLQSAWDYGQYRRWGLRGQLLWEPADNVSALYALDRSADHSAPLYLHLADPPATAVLAPMFSAEPRRAHQTRTAVPLEPSIGSITGHALTVDWTLDPRFALRSITAHRTLHQSQFDNWAGASDTFRPERQFARASVADMQQRQFSQELQLSGEWASTHFVLGAWYFEEDATEDAAEFLTNQFNADGTADRIIRFSAAGVPSTRASRNTSRSIALYGQGTWTLPFAGRRLSATAGLRHSGDDKSGRLTSIFGTEPPPHMRYHFESARVDPVLALQYRVAEDINSYLRWSSAYRSGGANSRSVSFRTFGPETIDSWEAGFKARLLEQRARLDLALYHMRYADLQIGFLMPDNPVNTETVNTTRAAHMRGAELEFGLIAGGGLRIGGSYAWTHVDIPPQINPFSGVAVRLAPMFAPRHAGTLELDHDIPLPGLGALSLHADANYWSGQYTHATDSSLSRPALVVNVRAAVQDFATTRGRVSLALWCRNLFNRSYEATGISSQNGPLLVFGDARSFGLDASIRLH